eukprot:1727414-Amphidinium_carterae.2
MQWKIQRGSRSEPSPVWSAATSFFRAASSCRRSTETSCDQSCGAESHPSAGSVGVRSSTRVNAFIQHWLFSTVRPYPRKKWFSTRQH